MQKTASLGDRMKGYENISRNYLTRRVPVIIRLDGKAFHTFTRGMAKPFSPILTEAMQETMKALCEGIQGCVLGYTQSDEITLVLTDYETISTDAWFGYNIQKMVSVAASMATLAFNVAFTRAYQEWQYGNPDADCSCYARKQNKAMFDARVFSVPKEEVCNCLIWRQQDATRNSIEAVGQAYFSQRQLYKKNCDQIQEMLWAQKGINWNDFPADLKRGSCCTKQSVETIMEDPRNPGQQITVTRSKWVVDHATPIFTQDREYIEKLL